MCHWFVDNKLPIHFGEGKIKCVLFSNEKNLLELNMTYNNNKMKQFGIVKYLGCYLADN